MGQIFAENLWVPPVLHLKQKTMKLRTPISPLRHSKWGFEEMKYVAHTSLWHYNACLVGKDVQRKLSSWSKGTWVQNGIWLVVEPTHLKNMNVNLENLPQIGVKICLRNIGNHHL